MAVTSVEGISRALSRVTRSKLESRLDGPHGIAPGSILTAGTRTLFYNPESKQKADSLISHIPLGRPGETDDIAAAALYLASDDAKYVTGHILIGDGGWTAGFSRDW